jgi:UDP-2-acetamido-3-amino-2,3-dideoxy-glucuronate N-acetyltransferase
MFNRFAPENAFPDHWDPNLRWIHPSAEIAGNARVGRFTIVEENCLVGALTAIGDFCKLMPGTVIGADCRIDDYANTSGAVVLGYGVMVKRQACVTQGIIAEDRSFLGPGIMVIHEQHVSWRRPGVKKVSRGIRIGSGAVVGGSALLLPGVDIGHNAWVAAGALVTKHCDPYGMYVGRPAKKVGEVPEEFHITPSGTELKFEPEVLERYLPELVGVGREGFR